MLDGFARCDSPFTHWIDRKFVSEQTIREINDAWPLVNDERWLHERRDYTTKSAIMFPRALPEPAQRLAASLYTQEYLDKLSALTGIADLLPDPWFTDGPLMPRVGGGLHEIHRGGLLKMHIDFSAHPAGLTRTLNLLVYLNLEWRDKWGGALQLGDSGVKIYPRGGTAVLFETTDTSWHGHPHPLMCPAGITRRSLAIYYYRKSAQLSERITTLYRKDEN